jgi:hypothetical protein
MNYLLHLVTTLATTPSAIPDDPVHVKIDLSGPSF